MSPIKPTEEDSIPTFRPRGRGKKQPNSNGSSCMLKMATVGGEGMEMVGREIWTGTGSETLSRQSSISDQTDTVMSADTRSLRSTSSRKNMSPLQLCIHASTPPSVSDDSFSAPEGAMRCSDSTRSSAGSDDCRSQTSFSDLADSDLLEVENLNIHQPVELAHRRSCIQSAGDQNIFHAREPTPCLMAPKLPPARQREKVLVKTNIYPLEVESRIVYRYDVRMYASRADTSKERTTDLCKGDKDDFCFVKFEVRSVLDMTTRIGSSNVSLRHQKCLLLMRRALELYRVLNESGAYLYDLASTLFTNEPLNKEMLPRLKISMEQLTPELRGLIGACDVFIEITPCAESAHTFNIIDYRDSITNDLARQDRSFRQFFEILTNNSALQKGTHYAFGCGKLFLVDGKKYKLNEQTLSESRTLVVGVDKGVRYIERSNGSIIPALVIDLKKAAFFDAVPLAEMVRKVLMKNAPASPIPPLDRNFFARFVKKLSDIVRELLFRLSVGKNVPPIPMSQYYKQQGYNIRTDWPAVRLVTNFGTSFFPIELLRVAPCQRVPVSKQTPLQMKDAIKECAVLPHVRFRDISRNLQALDLDEATHYNPFMAAFGVHVSSTPITVEGHRRLAPKVQYSNMRGGRSVIDVDNKNANWRMNGREYLIGAQLHCWFIFYDDPRDRDMIAVFAKILVRECCRKGIKMVDPVIKNVAFEQLEDRFKQIRETYPDERAFVMYIDSRDNTHDDLKLYEALHRIITQHVHGLRAREAPKKIATLENIINKLNCKNFGQCYGVVPESFATNRWISTGKTLIIGYDVCHPEPQPKHERRMRMTPTQPSVLGISFNGAVCPETFIGDYSYQEPRKEQVTGSILEERIYWILSLFSANRNGTLPETVIITRDGVSEGQFKMVMEDEIEAIRQGMRNFGKVEAGIDNYSPNIVCIIACKRHNKRFAIDNGRSLENCLPLTVIDRDITRPDVTEFFMQSHKIIKGTGKLPAYSIPVNEANLTMDEAQSLMMALCFTHQIVNQSISIPEPIYQADEWAKRGRNNFKAMLRRAGGKDRLPTLAGGSVDWNRVTRRLCYMDTELELTRANA
uniref:Piwi domain-containing protein n=1 Tax=Setaria digitata TaxID=48799 RepID=A0A915PLY5_9BILA